MDFTLSPEIEDLRLPVRAFVDDEVIALEADRANYNDYDNIKMAVLDEVREKAKAAGLWAPQMPTSRGGLTISMTAIAAAYVAFTQSITRLKDRALRLCAFRIDKTRIRRSKTVLNPMDFAMASGSLRVPCGLDLNSFDIYTLPILFAPPETSLLSKNRRLLGKKKW